MRLAGQFFSRRAAALAVLVCGVCFHAAYPGQLAAQGASGAVAAPLFRIQNGYRVQTLVNGKPASLLLDTGSPLSCINASRAAHFGLTPHPGDSRIPASTMVNGKPHATTIVPSLRLGSVHFTSIPCVLIDLQEMARVDQDPSAVAMDGILGLTFFLQLRAVIDLPGQRLILRPTSGAPVQVVPRRRGEVEIAMRLQQGHLFIPGNLNKTPVSWILDTGAHFAAIDHSLAKTARLRKSDPFLSSRGIHFNDRGTRAARVDRMGIGAFTAQNQAVLIFNLAKIFKAASGEKVTDVGLLGLNTMEMHDAIVDCGTLKLFLMPGAS